MYEEGETHKKQQNKTRPLLFRRGKKINRAQKDWDFVLPCCLLCLGEVKVVVEDIETRDKPSDKTRQDKRKDKTRQETRHETRDTRQDLSCCGRPTTRRERRQTAAPPCGPVVCCVWGRLRG